MEPVPKLQESRLCEALMLVVDSSISEDTTFSRLRDVAFRVARTRVIYPTGKDDLIGVIQAGSEKSDNLLWEQTGGEGYTAIQLHLPLVTASIRAATAISNMKRDGRTVNFIDVLDVAADKLCSTAALRARKYRLLLFTSSTSDLASPIGKEDIIWARKTLEKESNGNGEMDDDEENKTEPPEFITTCNLFKEHAIEVDIIVSCGDDENDKDTAQRIRDYEDLFHNDDDDDEDENNEEAIPSVQMCIQKAKRQRCGQLLVLSKCTGGRTIPLRDAETQIDLPVPRPRRGVSKFSGVLDIGGLLKIPVKRYTYTSNVKVPNGTRVSWEMTIQKGREIRVQSNTSRTKSLKDDAPLGPEDIIITYPYGPNVVPVPDMNVLSSMMGDDKDGDENMDENEHGNKENERPWFLHLERGLDVIGFVPQNSVSVHSFLSSIDVVIPMKSSPESVRLLRTLVLALNAEKMGVLARSVTSLRGGAPTLCYLWPHIEIDKEKRTIQNCFLFATQLPMREDIRDLPFASLEDELVDVPESTFDAMDQFISTMMLPMPKDDDDDESEEEDTDEVGDEDENEENETDQLFEKAIRILDPPNIANPNIHWLNLCVMHRIVNGTSCLNYPVSPTWHKKLTDPSSFIRKHELDKNKAAVNALQTSMPIIPARKRLKKNKRVHTALEGDLASIQSYLPNGEDDKSNEMPVEGEEQDNAQNDIEMGNEEHIVEAAEEEVESEGNNDNAAENEFRTERLDLSSWESDPSALSDMTDLTNDDIGDENPIRDFKSMVRRGKSSLAIGSMEVIIRRLIRDFADDNKAMECMQVMRAVCATNKDSDTFNSFVKNLVDRCNRKDELGNRTAAFFRHVGAKKQTAKTFKLLPYKAKITTESKGKSQAASYKQFEARRNNYIDNMIVKLTLNDKNADVQSLSHMTG